MRRVRQSEPKSPVCSESLDLNLAESHPSSVRLQPDKTWVRRAAAHRIRVYILGNLRTVEEHGIGLSLRMNLEFIPLARRPDVWILWRGKAIDGAGFVYV